MKIAKVIEQNIKLSDVVIKAILHPLLDGRTIFGKKLKVVRPSEKGKEEYLTYGGIAFDFSYLFIDDEQQLFFKLHECISFNFNLEGGRLRVSAIESVSLIKEEVASLKEELAYWKELESKNEQDPEIKEEVSYYSELLSFWNDVLSVAKQSGSGNEEMAEDRAAHGI